MEPFDPREPIVPGRPDDDTGAWWFLAFGSRDRYEAFEQAVRAYFKSHGMRALIMDGVVRTAPTAAGSGLQFGLLNLAQACAKSPPETWAAFVEKHFEAARRIEKDALGEVTLEQARTCIFPRLWDKADLPRGFEEGVCREDIAGLWTVLSLDLPEAVRGVTRREVEDWGVGDDELFDAAIANLRAKVRPDFVQAAEHMGNRLRVALNESFFVASLALILGEIPELSGEHGAFVAAPTRHSLAVLSFDEVRGLEALGGLIALTQDLSGRGPGAVSPRVWWWRAGEWLEVHYRLDGRNMEVSPPPELVEYIQRANDDAPE